MFYIQEYDVNDDEKQHYRDGLNIIKMLKPSTSYTMNTIELFQLATVCLVRSA